MKRRVWLYCVYGSERVHFRQLLRDISNGGSGVYNRPSILLIQKDGDCVVWVVGLFLKFFAPQFKSEAVKRREECFSD